MFTMQVGARGLLHGAVSDPAGAGRLASSFQTLRTRAAFNAASGLWPELRWLWRYFHLKKAVREKLVKKLSRPAGMESEEWTVGRRAIYQSAMHVLGNREAKDGGAADS